MEVAGVGYQSPSRRLCDDARMACLFCSSHGRCSTVEHVIPESLGNDDLMLAGHVCDGCK